MATLADDLIGNLLNAGGLIGKSFAEGRQNNLVEQQGQQQLQLGNMRIAAAKSADEQAQQYQSDVSTYMANPTPEARAALFASHPDQVAALKSTFDAQDEIAKQSQLDQFYGLHSVATNGRADLASKMLANVITAEKGRKLDTTEAESIQADLNSPDEPTRKAALKHLEAFTGGMYAALDPVKAKALGLLPDTSNHYTTVGSDGIMDQRTGQLVREPTLKGPNGEILIPDARGGGPASGGGGAGSGAPFDPRAFFKEHTLKWEGGYAAHDANGAPVNMGVNQAANPGVDVKNLTPDQAADIFATKYAAKSAGMPAALGGVYADTAYINPKRADQFLKASGGDPGKFLAMRQAWMQSLIAKDPGKYQPYAKAWANRNRDLGAYIAQQGGAQTVSSDGAPSGYHVAVPGKPKEAPSGYQWAADGKTLQAIPGGPADKGASADGTVGGLTSEALDYAANMALQNGGKIPPGFARNKAAQAALENAVAKKAADLGLSAKDVIAAGQNTNAAAKGVIAFSVGKQGDTVRSINVAVDHLAQLHDAAMALKNGNIPLFNRISQAWQQGTGSPLPTDAKAIRGIVADEVSKAVLASNGAVSDRADLHQNMDVAGSPEQIMGVTGSYIGLMGGQARGLQRQYEQATGRKDFNRFLAPNTIHALGMTHDSPIPTLTPAQAAKAPAGTMFRTTDGRTMKKR